MKQMIALFAVIVLAAAAVSAQKKPWSEWDKKEVEKMLNASPWGQTQADTDTSEMTVTFAGSSPAAKANTNNQAITLNYRIRLFSAKPIREAFARQVMLSNPNLKAAQLQNFVTGDYSESIVVAVAFDGPDRKVIGPIGQVFSSATTSTIKNKTYLERKDGKRVELDEYAAPTNDGTGAKFVFPRLVDGKPFVGQGDEFIRFVTDMGGGVKMNWRFKLSDMVYQDKLEY
jgi:hypothetical protein